jgi:hypothetical protein
MAAGSSSFLPFLVNDKIKEKFYSSYVICSRHFRVSTAGISVRVLSLMLHFKCWNYWICSTINESRELMSPTVTPFAAGRCTLNRIADYYTTITSVIWWRKNRNKRHHITGCDAIKSGKLLEAFIGLSPLTGRQTAQRVGQIHLSQTER